MGSNTKKLCFLYNKLLAEENIVKYFGKILSFCFPTVYNISKFYEIRRQKRSPALNRLTEWWSIFCLCFLTKNCKMPYNTIRYCIMYESTEICSDRHTVSHVETRKCRSSFFTKYRKTLNRLHTLSLRNNIILFSAAVQTIQ